VEPDLDHGVGVTAYPLPTDPVSALTRAESGITEAHSRQHGRLTGFRENVKAFGAVGTGDTTDDYQAFVDAIAAARVTASGSGRAVIEVPDGDYYIGNGQSIAVPEDTVIVGSGSDSGARITGSGAYIFKNLWLDLRDAATAGGAVKVRRGGITMENVKCEGVSTCTDPVVHLNGTVSSLLRFVRASGGAGHGILADADTTGFNNHNRYEFCYARAGSGGSGTYAGMKFVGGSNTVLEQCHIETSRGYGVHFNNMTNSVVHACWFEDNSNHNVFLESSGLIQIEACKLGYLHDDIAGADFVHVDGDSDHATILWNEMTGAPLGNKVQIASGAEDTVLMGNWGVNIDIADSGTRTVAIASFGADTFKLPSALVTLTDASPVTVDASAGKLQQLVATTSRTISAPTNPVVGQEVTILIHNSSGGSMTTTWDSAYRLGGAWTDPANGANRTITFVYNGTNWKETSRTTGDAT
jgi:hypothetical protein